MRCQTPRELGGVTFLFRFARKRVKRGLSIYTNPSSFWLLGRSAVHDRADWRHLSMFPFAMVIHFNVTLIRKVGFLRREMPHRSGVINCRKSDGFSKAAAGVRRAKLCNSKAAAPVRRPKLCISKAARQSAVQNFAFPKLRRVSATQNFRFPKLRQVSAT